MAPAMTTRLYCSTRSKKNPSPPHPPTCTHAQVNIELEDRGKKAGILKITLDAVRVQVRWLLAV